jgi:outer membrane protein assembly factor BamB
MQGGTLEGWPIQMGEVQGQVLVADLNADGKIEIFAADTLGNIALFNAKGRELWERHVQSMVAQGAVAGDLDGDGLLEIVFGSVDGRIHVVQGTDGKDKPGFPYQTTGR